MPQIRLLIAVDQLDRAIHQRNQERDDIRRANKALKERIEGLKHQLAVETSTLQTHTAEQQAREQLLASSEKKLARIGDFSHVKTEKELEAAQREVVSLKATRSRMEEELLEGFERTEQLQNTIAAIRMDLNARQQELATKHPEWKVAFDALGERNEADRKERMELVPQLEPELRGQYERLMMRYTDRAVVTIVDGRCPPCAVPVPAQHVVNVLMGASIHSCQHCGRLILPEGPV